MVNVQFACISVSIEPAVPLINPFECWDLYFLISTKIPCNVIGSYQAFEFNSLRFNFVCCFNCVRCIVKFGSFNRTAALVFGFCCEGLLAFFPVSLQLLTYCCPLQ